MSNTEPMTRRVSQWCYEGVWSIITKYFRVPNEPPRLQGADDQGAKSFRPAEGFLRYLKFQFWLLLIIIDLALFVGWLVLLFIAPVWLSALLTPPIWILIVVPDIIAYVAIHLRYDTTWYALSDRSMRIRRGIWVIHETTITYENIQNVTVNQGPLQRYFGISDVQVETAGGGGAAPGQSSVGHQGSLEGVDCPEEVRQLILLKWKQSKASGLGDEHDRSESHGSAFSSNPHQIILLEQIRDLAAELVEPSPI
jgi:membrane protein YdbS with pleckstrin-like domain